MLRPEDEVDPEVFAPWPRGSASSIHRTFCARVERMVAILALKHVSLTSGGSENYFTEMCSGFKAGSYLRLIDFCITQL